MKLQVTISILTFNRAQKLSQILNDIHLQNENDFYKIIIYDNSSTDNTIEIIKKFKLKIKNLKHVRQKKNIGFFYNYLQAISKCNTNYIWVLGDDDRINKGGLKLVKNFILKNKNFALLSLGSVELNNQNNNVNVNPKNYINKRVFDLKKDFYKMGEISRNIFNFKELNIFKPQKIFQCFPQLFFIKSLFSSKLPLFYLNENIISRNNVAPIDNDGNDCSASELKKRLRCEVNEYLFVIESIKNNLSHRYYRDIINILFNKNLRSWFVVNKIINNKFLFQSYYSKILWRNLNILNKIIIVIIKYFPLFIFKKIIYFKREKIQKNFNFKIKFLLIGIINTFVNYFFSIATYYLFYKDFGFVLYNILNILFGITFSFSMFKFFLFKTSNHLYLKEYIKSYVVYALKISIGIFLLFIFLELLKINIFMSQALSIALTTLFTYKGHKNYTFKK
jgi:glycosyltransferase involved in cell wall biosynthesis